MKKFKVVAIAPDSGNEGWVGDTHGIAVASVAGWNSTADGRKVLQGLEVGQQATDDDGDTWERVA